jgi:tRNA pseudouridine55 synthase
MNGVLLIDKPSGLTSHDVVAWVRRTIGERRVGHAGTLDPMATGLLVVLVGQATRLSPYLAAKEKTYEATVRLGVRTTTDDAEGEPINGPAPVPLEDEAVLAALESFRGSSVQRPPAYSAKKVGGQIAYDLARRDQAVDLQPVAVTVTGIERVVRLDDMLEFQVTASPGFYVRALARDIGERLGCGGHLAALRRLRSGSFDVASATTLADGAALGAALADRLIPMAEALPDLPAVTVSGLALSRVAHGNWIGPEHLGGAVAVAAASGRIGLLSPAGELLGLAEGRAGALHPVVVLG